MASIFKKNFFPIVLFIISFVILLVAIRINLFRYNNFDFGKFDLGNMTQMVWNTLNGRFMYLTDYFGTNLPRWAMSHVDPILVLFVPLFALFPHPLTLVFSQLVLVIFSSLLIYKLAYIVLDSKPAAFFLGLSFLMYPAIGFLLAWTGFHGVTAIIPFFLGAFILFEVMDRSNNFSKTRIFSFWILVVLSLMGKEEVSLFVFMFGTFVYFVKKRRVGLSLMIVGVLWFVTAFFILIPSYARYRIDGYVEFASDLGIDSSIIRNVGRPNYFLNRYAQFGKSYSEVIFNMVLSPRRVIDTMLSGDKLANLRMTFAPLLYTSLLAPEVFIISLPEFLINYLTTEGGIGTSEISNHRISMIVPILFLASIYGIKSVSKYSKYIKISPRTFVFILSFLILVSNIYTSSRYNNPLYLWFTQAVKKRIAFAKTESDLDMIRNLKVGDVLRLSKLETKDRECAKHIVEDVPRGASVSGPDYLGAHLSMRRTYAIFPALFNKADFVIIDVFSKKILTILDIETSLVRDIVGRIMKEEDYKLVNACGNLFVFQRIGYHNKSKLLPLQEKFDYTGDISKEISQTLYLANYNIPQRAERGVPTNANFAYIKNGSNSLNEYVLFMTFINSENGNIYQVANLPSYGLKQLSDWEEGRYYLEDLEIIFPKYLEAGKYKAFVGMTNNIKTRSIYLGDIEVL